jgi:hypothetical protein
MPKIKEKKKMKYLVICKDQTAFWTDWYTYENMWNGETIHCVVDVAADKVTFNGKDWQEVEYDHL